MANTASIEVSGDQKQWLDAEAGKRGYASGAEYLAKIVEEEQTRAEWGGIEEPQKQRLREVLTERVRLAREPDAEWLTGEESREKIREMSRRRRLHSK